MKIFNHIRRLETNNGIVIDYDGFDINFSYRFTADSTSNQCTIDLYNISKYTLRDMNSAESIKLFVGYNGFGGYIFIGKIDAVTIEKKSNGDVLTKLQCTPDAKAWNKNFICKSWSQRVSYSYVAEEIIKDAGWNVGNLSFLNNREGVPFRYIGGKYFRAPARECLEEISKDAQLSLHFSNNKVYMYPKNTVIAETIIVSAKDGSLIDIPVEQVDKKSDNKKYKIKTVLRYDYSEGGNIKIEGSDYIDDSEFKILEGSHVATDSDMYTELIIEKQKDITTTVSNSVGRTWYKKEEM